MPKDFEAPSFPFYPDDFVSDGKVEAMTTEEVGAYLLLLCKSWREKPAASIPNNDQVLARWARLTPDRWSECKQAVLSPWKHLRALDRWMQPRLKREHDKMLARRRSTHEAATTAAKARWQNSESMRSACVTHATGNANGMRKNAVPVPSPSPVPKDKPPDPQGGRAGSDEFTPAFRDFWNAVPPRGRERSSRAQAFSAWKRQGCEAAADAVTAGLRAWVESEAWTKEGGQFVPGIHGWLRNRKWTELPAPAADVDPLSAPPRPMTDVERQVAFGSDTNGEAA